MLKGQDIVMLLSLATGRAQTVRARAEVLGWDPASVHRSLARLTRARLYEPKRNRTPMTQAEEFLVHGVPYVFPASPGEVTRGVPTAWGAPPLRDLLAIGDELPPVWPDPLGAVRGASFEPLHPIALTGAEKDPLLRELLMLVDGIRGGDARTRSLASALLHERLVSL